MTILLLFRALFLPDTVHRLPTVSLPHRIHLALHQLLARLPRRRFPLPSLWNLVILEPIWPTW